ncbi:lysine N(6)-hydroxylase/L-ornithine N(5)-oxygenase family protein [Chromohalobacter sp. TMW 2.2299]|uniref:Lysine N(6)-hydroxylase/L-ornithine N(5)-oxygenase family protein n=2 Tax=Chromohalobacter moromii TaxID=2860329 RepID=A0A9X2X0D7_9GAMM|nr:lysine N(6)-hydroxylase/L-ornithine N(5)-oxygenase family protein [Chromohalobacter moromii]MCT8504308.1 lysine N(6)-hydroxylase/L-ornithine N(5)-oxygenase family protein [Chromohalobacter moromii]
MRAIMPTPIHDFIAIGLGPFNLGLACLTDPLEDVNGLFLERKAGFDWHPGMLLEDATLQTPFLADLVTLADPTSRFSFLNYLKRQDKLYAFYIRENFFPLRREYNHYCQWAIDQLTSIRFHHEVQRIDFDADDDCYVVHCVDTARDTATSHRARKLVLGTGTQPDLPACCRPHAGRITHSADYLAHKAWLQQQPAITLVGSGQSAAEIYKDLLQDIDRYGYTLSWITRSPRFFPLEYGKLTLEMTSPEYIDYFHALPQATRDELMSQQANLYKGIDLALVNEIYDLLYAKRLGGPVDTHLLTNAELQDCHYDAARATFELDLYQTEQRQPYRHTTPALVMATGYRYREPGFLSPIHAHIRRDTAGRFAVDRFYSIDHDRSRLFVQNAERHTHGLAAPDLGMACYRNACIIRELTGVEHYPIERRIAFQTFGTPDNAVFRPAPRPARRQPTADETAPLTCEVPK